jgi:hypothetical protein
LVSACCFAGLQGDQCATINITIADVGLFPTFALADKFVTKTVCWFKPADSEHADAAVAISTKGLCDVASDNKTSELKPPYQALMHVHWQHKSKHGFFARHATAYVEQARCRLQL